MIHVSSGRASKAEGNVDAGRRFVRLVWVAAAILLLTSGFKLTGSAYAQSGEDAASCVEKCKSDEKQCLYNGSSEELCDYDSKGCQKACAEKK